MRRAFKGWMAAAVVGTAPAALAATVVEPRARLTLEERYDDDFRLRDGRTSGQMMTKVTPRLGLDVKDPTLTLESFYAADLLMRHGSGNVTLDHRAGLDVRKALSRRLRVELSGRLYRVTDPLSLPREGIARANQPIFYAQARAYAVGRLTQRVDVGTGYFMETARVLEGGQDTGYVHTPYVEAWLRATRRLSLGAEYRYQAFVFGEDFAQAHGVAGALRYRLSRQTSFTARAGPVSYAGADGTRGVLPRVRLELLHEAENNELGVIAGHELVGASGFTSALWADFAGAAFTRHFNTRLSAFAGASFFRNGRAPGEGAFTLDPGPGSSQGYALGVGVELKLNQYVALQGTVDRIAQVGAGAAEETVALTRNIAAVRLHLSAW